MVSSILPKNKRKNATLLLCIGTSSRIVFVHFLGELKTPKRHFEINWPLVDMLHISYGWHIGFEKKNIKAALEKAGVYKILIDTP